MATTTTPRKRGRPKKIKKAPVDPNPCIRCGRKFTKYEGNFFKNAKSDLFLQNDSRIPICSHCLEEIQKDLEKQFRDKRLVYMALCAFCDYYYTDKAFYDIADKPDCSFGKYCRLISGQQQYKTKTFRDTITELNDTITELTTPADMPIARKMNDQDKKNLTYVVSSIGYDCFDDDSWSDDDRRFAYNTLADYLTDDVLEDPHKVQSVIAMVKTYVQVEQIDKILNMELRKNRADADQLNKLSGVKKGLLAAINAMAKENGISAITSGKKTQGSNTLSGIMKEMSENGFEEIKVNVVDSRLSESYKEVATDNIKAIIEELSFTGDEYADMLSKQTELVSKQQDRISILEEDKRKLKIEIKELKDEIAQMDARRRSKK